MDKLYIKALVTTLILIIAQVVLFNHIRVFTYFMPIVYMYAIFKLPANTSRMIVTLFGAAAGLSMDLLMNTAGLNMAAATLVAYVRQPMLPLFLPDENEIEENEMLSIWNMKLWKYVLMTVCLVAIHITTLLLLEAFSVQLFHNTIPYIIGSTVMTLPIFFILDTFYSKRRHRS